MTGADAENWLGDAGIIVNKNMIPFDERKPVETSGLRIGTPALTTRGLREADMTDVGNLIAEVINANGAAGVIEKTKARVAEICQQFPLPG